MRCAEHLTLDQLLSDPLIRMLMFSDAVKAADVRAVMRKIRPATQNRSRQL